MLVALRKNRKVAIREKGQKNQRKRDSCHPGKYRKHNANIQENIIRDVPKNSPRGREQQTGEQAFKECIGQESQ